MVTAVDICITAMTQSRPDQELLALEMFGFLARATPACAIVIALTHTADASSARAARPSEPFCHQVFERAHEYLRFLNGRDAGGELQSRDQFPEQCVTVVDALRQIMVWVHFA